MVPTGQFAAGDYHPFPRPKEVPGRGHPRTHTEW